MKQCADKHGREVEFKVGEWVQVKLRPYRQKTLARRLNEKLSARFYRPFEIEERIGMVAYKLKLPEEAKIHPTFHVSQLKKAVGETRESLPLPPQLNREGELLVVPEGVIATHVHAGTGQKEVFIKWQGLPDHECSWEWVAAIKKKFLNFNLEDKVNFAGDGNDTYEALRPPILFHYKRRAQK